MSYYAYLPTLYTCNLNFYGLEIALINYMAHYDLWGISAQTNNNSFL